MLKHDDRIQDIFVENERLKLRLQEAEDVLNAIRYGGVDALVISGADGDQVYTLSGADRVYRILFETINEGATILGADGTVFFCNNRLSSMLKRPMETIIGHSILRFVTAEDSRSFEALLNQGLEEPQEKEFALKSHDGSIVPCHISTSPFSIEDSSNICMIVADITERRKAEEALRESELRLNLALSGAGLGSWDYNVETGETVCDQRLAKMLGFSLDQMQPHAPWWENLIHPDDWPRTMEIFNAHMEGRTPLYEAEFRVRPRLGDWKWILARGSVVERDKDGKPSRVAGTYIDVTERKRSEEALRRSEERFRAIFDHAKDIIFIMDSNIKYRQVNPAMAKILELDVSEIIGRKPEDIYGEEVGRQLRLLDLRVLEGESIEREHTVRIKGVSLTLNTVLRPLHNTEGEIIGIFGISRDVTERTRLLPSPKAVFESYPSEAMRTTMREARSAAAGDGVVLLQGESGSGKDYMARWIHDHSKRALGPYFSLNCAAISRELAESELFGHERGAFTGAHGRKRGLLELAEGGTLLLNEIGELPLSLQSKLLTFLDTRSFLRVGGEKPTNVNARIISATNRSLEKEVEEGRFLSALFYRINVFGINLPPLRDRIDDIPVLLEEIMSRLAVELQLTRLPYIDPGFAIALARYDWPGNVRELRNAIERALMLSDGHNLSLTLPSAKASREDWSHVSSFPLQERTLHDVTDEVTKSLILEALRRCRGNRRQAARMLGIARDSLYRYMKRFGITSENQTADQDN
jgi:PAS domain S-box-containing protein